MIIIPVHHMGYRVRKLSIESVNTAEWQTYRFEISHPFARNLTLL